jgi:hypothetical protein
MMATFIPDIEPEQIGVNSERLVFEALRELPSGFVVLHSFPWLRPNRDFASEPLREGEADFVILHPNRGLLVLEVKGGHPELRQRTWFRSGKQMRDPFEQARINRYALLNAVEERTNRRIHRGMFVHGDVVIFPHCTYEGPLPLNTDPRIFFDGRVLPELRLRLEAAWDAWQRQPRSLTRNQFRELHESLMPKLRLMRFVGADIANESARIVQITEDQQATLQGLLASERVLVEGTGGSGKTLLALEFAVSLSAAGNKVLLLCYNRHLAAWLQENASGETRLRNREGLLEIATFHSYAFKLAKRANIEFEIPKIGTDHFWDEEVPLILEQALDVLRNKGNAPAFDLIIVDEAQDFSPDWWVTVESLTRDGRNGRLYVFLDLNQSLRGESRLPSVPLPAKFRLTTNCRNTRAIARSAGCLSREKVTLLPGSPEGETPSVHRAGTQKAEARLAIEEVRRLLRIGIASRQIVLIGPAAYDKGALAQIKDVGGVTLVSEADAWRRGDGILVTTSRAFKGLEADIVILYDLVNFSTTFTPTDLYVAWTRARHRLIIVCHGSEVRAVIEKAIAEAERSLET